jgi:hypothetical protein
MNRIDFVAALAAACFFGVVVVSRVWMLRLSRNANQSRTAVLVVAWGSRLRRQGDRDLGGGCNHWIAVFLLSSAKLKHGS